MEFQNFPQNSIQKETEEGRLVLVHGVVLFSEKEETRVAFVRLAADLQPTRQHESCPPFRRRLGENS
jgi:hypothetical protein